MTGMTYRFHESGYGAVRDSERDWIPTVQPPRRSLKDQMAEDRARVLRGQMSREAFRRLYGQEA